jgi:hypothetical protein
MSYKKQNFKDGQVLNADQMNKIENAIVETEELAVAAAQGVTNLEPIISTTDITAGSAAPNSRPYHVIE